MGKTETDLLLICNLSAKLARFVLYRDTVIICKCISLKRIYVLEKHDIGKRGSKVFVEETKQISGFFQYKYFNEYNVCMLN